MKDILETLESMVMRVCLESQEKTEQEEKLDTLDLKGYLDLLVRET